MLIYKVAVPVQTGNPAQPTQMEARELTKTFELETKLEEVAEYLLGKDVHHAQLILENSDRPRTPRLALPA